MSRFDVAPEEEVGVLFLERRQPAIGIDNARARAALSAGERCHDSAKRFWRGRLGCLDPM